MAKPTSRHIKRWQQAQDVGCVACALDGVIGVPGDVHHLTSGGRRISHSATIILCPWHHRGILPSGRTAEDYAFVHGPSLAHTPRAFKEKYGDEEEILAIQDALLDHYEESTGE